MSFDKEKIVETLVYIASKKPRIGKHQMAKILYYADQKHLVKYGRPVIEDRYIAMRNGPVPSLAYDIIKNVNDPGFSIFGIGDLAEKLFVIGNQIEAVIEPDLDFFSKTDIECLDESFEENKDLSFAQLSMKSHSYAWNRADLNNEMSIVDIAEEESAPVEIVNSIRERLEDKKGLGHLAKN